jgi:hypothetical protein
VWWHGRWFSYAISSFALTINVGQSDSQGRAVL